MTSETLDKVFNQYKKIFVGRVEELKAFVLQYCIYYFEKYKVIDGDRVDASERIQTAGYYPLVSGWRNYKVITLSSCQDSNKHFDYNFTFEGELHKPRIVESSKAKKPVESARDEAIEDTPKGDLEEEEIELTEEEIQEKREELEQKIVEIRSLVDDKNYYQVKKETFEANQLAKSLELTDIVDQVKKLKDESDVMEKEEAQVTFEEYVEEKTLQDVVEAVSNSKLLKSVRDEALNIEEKIKTTEDPEKREKLEAIQKKGGYSVRNYLFVLAQARNRGDDKFVGVINSYWNWKRTGAQVNRNPDKSKPFGYKIFMPKFGKRKSGGDFLAGFKMGTVFDISQTNRYEDFLAVREHAKDALEFKDEIDYETAVSFVENNFSGITIEIDSTIDAEKGTYNSDTNTIRLKEETSHGLFHQVGYKIIQSELEVSITDEDAEIKNEMLAEVTAYLLMKRFEEDSTYKVNYDFGYSNVWAKNILNEYKFREFEKLYNSIIKYVKDLAL